jgi:hypothetical protein
MTSADTFANASANASIMERWIRAKERGRFAHAHILSGPGDENKKTQLIAVLTRWLCAEGRSCGICGPCRRLAREQSEAVWFVRPEGQQIKVDHVRSIREFLSLQSLTPVRAVVIAEAELMSTAAANALLKILEEPPPDSYFFLLARQSAMLPSTVRSRCQVTYFHSEDWNPAPIDEIEAEAAEWAVRWFEELVENPPSARRRLRSASLDREQARGVVRRLQAEWRARRGDLVNDLDTGGWWRWAGLGQGLIDLAIHLDMNVDPTLAMENLVFELEESHGGP